jgi:hypothetical protein
MRYLFAAAVVVLALIALGLLRASIPTVPPPCERAVGYSTLPSLAAIGALLFFWLGGFVPPASSTTAGGQLASSAELAPPRRKGIPVYLTLTAALLITSLLLGYEVFAVATQSKPDVTITHYVRCAYGSADALASVASVAAAWAACLILGKWFSYRGAT